ncbi:Dihydrodipicolinate synthetase family protein [Rubripirellula lacrimiformis]|uniref:Dihydrodipicolinate synthetase family protein n=1 Tax=Rubripirellula lacrimiformis TaxID=1930273 RepID=A0A517N4V9_9BACT|nr:dihydrodipicolinate synthase family protein [Rubripirellula lacrimiformis]QDT02171.1 Dihydrodipicolinate synthetase family protein [Rubripirellula lacrimiformis]
MQINEIPKPIRDSVQKGIVIPAMPLALDAQRGLDRQCQAALARYYIDAGVGGIAVGVHTTQFAIRDPGINLFEPVLKLTSEVIDDYSAAQGRHVWKVAGVCGTTQQAVREATFAVDHGYHSGLLSLAALAGESHDKLLDHCREVAAVIPVIGFYLQPAVGGCKLPYSFWREFAEIENVIAIKMAPFNRYQTLDVVRAVCDSGCEDKITLYTGNDDNIIVDLLTEYRIACDAGPKSVRIRGGLLGHWSVWARAAVELLDEVHAVVASGNGVPSELLRRNIELTDCNAAFFDAANDFAGCIPGIHEVLRRQGLMRGTWCLDPNEVLSQGQSQEIDRVTKAYPHLNDDGFVQDNLRRWLS